MIEFEHGCLIEDASELPDLVGDTLYCDLETTSCDRKMDSLNPWDVDHCRVWVLVIAVDDSPVYAIPRHLLSLSWLRKTMSACKRWVNHNVKYDAHVLANDLGVVYEGELVCTLNFARILDSDRTYKGGYGLKVLSKEWLGIDVDHHGKRMAPYLEDSKDYGAVPVDILADYGCSDVYINRLLYDRELQLLPEDSETLWRTEQELTRVLFHSERIGLKIDRPGVTKALLIDTKGMIDIRDKLIERLGYDMNPSSNPDCFDLFCNRFGLPPVYADEKSDNPSFGKAVLAEYANNPHAPKDLIQLVQRYRGLNIHKGLFWEPWLKLSGLAPDGRLHPDFNQNVRSGRMSARNPNAQQLDKRAKGFVLVDDGYVLLSCDYKQVEYRLIAHFIQDAAIIAAYAEDPDIDYHALVATLCSITRRPAKTINFMLGFGGGRAKTVSMLRAMSELMTESMTMKEIDKRANEVYDTYHKMMPGLKRKSRKAERIAKQYGYVRNPFGRRLYLPRERAHIAFNRVVQSSAADVMKERAVAFATNPAFAARDWRLLAIVHDEFLVRVPLEDAEEANKTLPTFLCQTPVEFRVPLLADSGWSGENWAKAG